MFMAWPYIHLPIDCLYMNIYPLVTQACASIINVVLSSLNLCVRTERSSTTTNKVIGNVVKYLWDAFTAQSVISVTSYCSLTHDTSHFFISASSLLLLTGAVQCCVKAVLSKSD